MNRTIVKKFPLPTIQSGALLGNGRLGLMLWGAGNILNVTMGSSEIWDHRGGLAWTPEQNFADLRRALEAHDEAKVEQMFSNPNSSAVSRPSLLSIGRVVITLPPAAELKRYEQPLDLGLTRVIYAVNGQEQTLEFCCDMSCRYGLAVRGLTAEMTVKLVSSWDLSVDEQVRKFHLNSTASLSERGLVAPERYASGAKQAFWQPCPADPAFGVILTQQSGEFQLTLQNNVPDLDTLLQLDLPMWDKLYPEVRQWWQDFWQHSSSIALDNPELEEIYYHGMYKFAIMTNPAGRTPGLQGPWIEDDHLPPWSGDYHFNINIEMCHAPGFKAGCFANLKMFFDLVLSWREKMRYNAKCFAGIDDGYMLPHAVDDHCTCMGAFWTGCIDQACAAWVAQMMYDYCDYSGDVNYLRTEVWDFMRGVMKVFQVMIDRQTDGTLALPVSISPEYNGASLNAWGRNSSFQLAAIHSLARNLLQTSAWLGLEPEPFWREVEEKLPQFSLSTRDQKPKIGLWDGQELEVSHRHHSHLGGICPFGTLDVDAPELQEVLQNSIYQWIKLGMGEWTGWCVPWAAQIHTRIHQPDAAVMLLELWKKVFTNAGGGSLHDGNFKGLTIYSQFRGEVMQMDGAMGAVAAVQDLLAHEQNGKLKFFYGIPARWEQAQFDRLYLPHGLRAAGRFCLGRTQELILTATRDCQVTLATPDCPEYFTLTLTQGQTVKLVPGNQTWQVAAC